MAILSVIPKKTNKEKRMKIVTQQRAIVMGLIESASIIMYGKIKIKARSKNSQMMYFNDVSRMFNLIFNQFSLIAYKYNTHKMTYIP